MRFEDKKIEAIDPRTGPGIQDLLENLCGERVHVGCLSPIEGRECKNCQGCINWSVLAKKLQSESITVEILNECLLLANQFPISNTFFDFFIGCGKPAVTVDELKAGIARFKGIAVLLYGNLRFGFRKLYKATKPAFFDEVGNYALGEPELLACKYKPREKTPELPARIDGQKTWLLGYIAKGKADEDLATYSAMAVLCGAEDEQRILAGLDERRAKLYFSKKTRLETCPSWRNRFPELSQIEAQITRLRQDLLDTLYKGWINTSYYLALNCIDVYVATSMREQWEFEDVHQASARIFAQDVLRDLKLRHFDPTQSYLKNRVDKGLVESLMLKRADCTVYMAQESDTLGKDSELAATLAQGKPVVAFIPEIIVEQYAETAMCRPIAYLRKRLAQLSAENKIDAKNLRTVYAFLQVLAEFQPYFQVIGDEETEFIISRKLDNVKKDICAILADSEKKFFDSRADTLQRNHPLALQVQLDKGVANGVLVVRSEEHTAEVVRDLLMNTASFYFDREREKGTLSLIERISESPFRVVTENATISNSFWSRYLVQG